MNRYDIIIYGAMILEYLMDRMRLSHITVSDADGMEGYLIYKRRGG